MKMVKRLLLGRRVVVMDRIYSDSCASGKCLPGFEFDYRRGQSDVCQLPNISYVNG